LLAETRKAGDGEERVAVAPMWMSVVDEVNYNLHKIKKRSTLHYTCGLVAIVPIVYQAYFL
jgi:hypothetical protein